MSQSDNNTAKKPGVLRGILTAAIVIGLLLAGLVLTSRVVRPKSNRSEFHSFDPASTGAAAEPDDSLDVLFVGDSIPFCGIEPLRIWKTRGFTSHVLFILAANMPDVKTMLETVEPYQHPKIIVFETNALFKRFTFDDALMHELQMTFPVLRYHTRWRWLTPTDLTATPARDWLDPSKGYRPNSTVDPVPEDEQDDYGTAPKEVEELDPFCQWYLAHLVDYCRSMGATPVFMSLPSLTNWNMARHNHLDAWARSHDVDYIDLNAEPTKVALDWDTDTKDAGEHLNTSGADKVTLYVSNLLADRYDLTDHRGDEDYAAWDEAYAAYYKL